MKQEDCIKTIRLIKNHADVRVFWENILQKNTPKWDAGQAFEYLMLRAFEIEGAKVTWPYEVTLFGETVEQIDGAILIESTGLTAIFECKDRPNDNVNIEPVAKLRNQLLGRPSGCIRAVFCTKEFTEPAIILAHFLQPHSIILWERDSIEYCIENQCFIQGLLKKNQMNLTHRSPNFNLRI